MFRVSAFGGCCIFCVSGVKSARIGQNPLVSVFQLFQVRRGCVLCFRFCVGAVFRVSGFRGKLCFVFRVLQAETLSGVEGRCRHDSMTGNHTLFQLNTT